MTRSVEFEVKASNQTASVFDEVRTALRGIAAEAKRPLDAQQQMVAAGKKLSEQLRTPVEEYTLRLSELQEMLAAGAIEHEIYERAVAGANDELVRQSVLADKNAESQKKLRDELRNVGRAGREAKDGSGADFGGRLLTRAGLGRAGIAASVFGYVSTLKSEFADLNKLASDSQLLGADPADLQKMRYAGQQTGVDVANVDDALKNYTKTASLARHGNTKAAATFSELRVSASSLLQMPLAEQMLELADAFAAVEGEEDRLRLATKLFGQQGEELADTLGQGRKALAGLFAEREKNGPLFSADELKNIQEVNAEFAKIKEQISNINKQTVVGIFSTDPAHGNRVQRTVKRLGNNVIDAAGRWSRGEAIFGNPTNADPIFGGGKTPVSADIRVRNADHVKQLLRDGQVDQKGVDDWLLQRGGVMHRYEIDKQLTAGNRTLTEAEREQLFARRDRDIEAGLPNTHIRRSVGSMVDQFMGALPQRAEPRAPEPPPSNFKLGSYLDALPGLVGKAGGDGASALAGGTDALGLLGPSANRVLRGVKGELSGIADRAGERVDAAEKAQEDLKRTAERILRANRTPEESFLEAKKKAEEAMRAGLIGRDDLDREVLRAGKERDDALATLKGKDKEKDRGLPDTLQGVVSRTLTRGTGNLDPAAVAAQSTAKNTGVLVHETKNLIKQLQATQRELASMLPGLFPKPAGAT